MLKCFSLHKDLTKGYLTVHNVIVFPLILIFIDNIYTLGLNENKDRN